MISTKTLACAALAVFAGLLNAAGCGGSDGSGATSATEKPTTTTTTTGGDPASCGHEAEKCCSSGAPCGTGLTCSDEYCLTCGPAPASLAGCTNVALAGTATAGTTPGATPDDAHAVIDGNVCTSWNYGNYGDPNAFWQVDLGSAQAIQALTIWPKMTPADGSVTFRIQYKSAEADAFADYPNTDGLTMTLHDYHPWQTTFNPPLTARFFRITILGTPSFAALREVGLFTHCTQ
jgi:hypothetical protein